MSGIKKSEALREAGRFAAEIVIKDNKNARGDCWWYWFRSSRWYLNNEMMLRVLKHAFVMGVAHAERRRKGDP